MRAHDATERIFLTRVRVRAYGLCRAKSYTQSVRKAAYLRFELHIIRIRGRNSERPKISAYRGSEESFQVRELDYLVIEGLPTFPRMPRTLSLFSQRDRRRCTPVVYIARRANRANRRGNYDSVRFESNKYLGTGPSMVTYEDLARGVKNKVANRSPTVLRLRASIMNRRYQGGHGFEQA